MIIPCVSCQSMFRLDNNLIKTTGSKVRCSKCHEIFMVYPPDDYKESDLSIQKSKRDQSVSIPNVEHSLLDDLLEVGNRPKAANTRDGQDPKSDANTAGENASIGNLEEE